MLQRPKHAGSQKPPQPRLYDPTAAQLCRKLREPQNLAWALREAGAPPCPEPGGGCRWQSEGFQQLERSRF